MLNWNIIKTLLLQRDEEAQTLVEYGLILALISLMGLIGLGIFAGGATQLWDVVNSAATCMNKIVSGESCA